jgi:hypothetical protein
MTGNIRTTGCVQRAEIPARNQLKVKYEGLRGADQKRAQEALWRAYLAAQFADDMFEWLATQAPAKAKTFWTVGAYGVKKIALAANFGRFGEKNVNAASAAVQAVLDVFTQRPLIVKKGSRTQYSQRENTLEISAPIFADGAIPSMASKEVLVAISSVVAPQQKALAVWLRKRMDFAYDCIVTEEQV